MRYIAKQDYRVLMAIVVMMCTVGCGDYRQATGLTDGSSYAQDSDAYYMQLMQQHKEWYAAMNVADHPLQLLGGHCLHIVGLDKLFPLLGGYVQQRQSLGIAQTSKRLEV